MLAKSNCNVGRSTCSMNGSSFPLEPSSTKKQTWFLAALGCSKRNRKARSSAGVTGCPWSGWVGSVQSAVFRLCDKPAFHTWLWETLCIFAYCEDFTLNCKKKKLPTSTKYRARRALLLHGNILCLQRRNLKIGAGPTRVLRRI